MVSVMVTSAKLYVCARVTMRAPIFRNAWQTKAEHTTYIEHSVWLNRHRCHATYHGVAVGHLALADRLMVCAPCALMLPAFDTYQRKAESCISRYLGQMHAHATLCTRGGTSDERDRKWSVLWDLPPIQIDRLPAVVRGTLCNDPRNEYFDLVMLCCVTPRDPDFHRTNMDEYEGARSPVAYPVEVGLLRNGAAKVPDCSL